MTFISRFLNVSLVLWGGGHWPPQFERFHFRLQFLHQLLPHCSSKTSLLPQFSFLLFGTVRDARPVAIIYAKSVLA